MCFEQLRGRPYHPLNMQVLLLRLAFWMKYSKIIEVNQLLLTEEVIQEYKRPQKLKRQAAGSKHSNVGVNYSQA